MDTIVDYEYKIDGTITTIAANLDSTWTVTYDPLPDDVDSELPQFTAATLSGVMSDFGVYLMRMDSRFYTDLLAQINESFKTYITNPRGLDIEFSGLLLASIHCNETNCTYDLYQTLQGNYVAVITNRTDRFDWNHWENMDLERQKLAVRSWMGSSTGAKALYSVVGISCSVILK